MSEVTYVSAPDGPIKVGEYRGEDIMCFGLYKVRFDDGFTWMGPHSGFPHTVSEEPLDVDEPDERAHLVGIAEEARANHER